MAHASDGAELHPRTLELARGPNLAAMSTSLPSGGIQTQYVWVGTDGSRLFVNTEVHRAKFRNVQRDPRVTLAILDAADPYRYVEVRGRVVATATGDEARRDNDELSRKYWGTDFPHPASSERVVLFVEAERQIVYG